MKRGTFLKALSALGGALVGLGLSVPPLAAFLSPLVRRKTSETWLALGEAEFFDREVPVRVNLPDIVQDAWVESRVVRSMWVYTEDGENFTVYNGHCTHLGCQYAWETQPDVPFHPERNVFHCPCHHAIYTVTGDVVRGPAPRPLDTLDTKIEDGVLYARYEDFRLGIPEKVPM